MMGNLVRELVLPLSEGDIRSLNVGDPVRLSGVILTARDTAHRWMVDTFIRRTREPSAEDQDVYSAIKPLLDGGALYHCGPVVAGLETGEYRFIAAGPTTSMREEPFQAEVIEHFNVSAIIGKGGMGSRTLEACTRLSAVYLHAVGGAASLTAQSVRRVLTVYKLDFGVPEALWVIEVRDFPAVVTMDAHGNSLHADVKVKSKSILDDLLYLE
jgi:fumarate hydratase subunit beta